MESGERKVQCVRVKRKASEQPLVGNKRCKLVGSFAANEEPKTTLNLKEKDLEIVDLNCLPESSKIKTLFRECSDEITCNGVILSKVLAEDYVYDYYVFDDDDKSEDEISENDEELSSCDENHPYNDYPDEDEYDYEEYDYYREWEDDEQKIMRKTIECNSDDDDYDLNESFNE